MLILRLQTPDDTEFAYAKLEGHAASAEWQQGTWAQVSKMKGNQAVVLLIPSADVLLTRTLLVTSNNRQLKQALPYALEENLVGEVEDQHFVWQAENDSMLAVAVIDRNRLKAWMQTLKQQKLRAKAILPDIFALPWVGTMPTVWQKDGQAWVRTGAYSGFSCPAISLPLLVDSLFEAEDQAPTIQLYTDQVADWQQRLTVIPEPQPNHLLQSSLQAGMALNLLNGYQDESMSNFKRNWRRWEVAASLALFCAAVWGGIQGMDIWRMAQQVQAAEQQNLALFQEVFPAIKDIQPDAIRSRVKSELTLLERASSPETDKMSLLPYLTMVGKVFQQEQGLKVTEIRARDGRLSVVFETADLKAIERIGQGLTKLIGREVGVKSTQANNIVRGEVTLDAGGENT
ncbi:type II secretion system protein GspL [Thiothrix eikelboomii]|uniref:type II secretion system protein GspL n=1 Tax=Thiothrix eikelboomii TaxID=92487 RepID=UPI003BB0E006